MTNTCRRISTTETLLPTNSAVCCSHWPRTLNMHHTGCHGTTTLVSLCRLLIARAAHHCAHHIRSARVVSASAAVPGPDGECSVAPAPQITTQEQKPRPHTTPSMRRKSALHHRGSAACRLQGCRAVKYLPHTNGCIDKARSTIRSWAPAYVCREHTQPPVLLSHCPQASASGTAAAPSAQAA